MSKQDTTAASTEGLLIMLNADKASATAEPAPVVPSDHITIPAGSQKVIFLRPSQIAAHRARGGRGSALPAFMVYVNDAAGNVTAHYAFSFRGNEVEPRVHMSAGELPYGWMPRRIPGTEGMSAINHQIDSLDWWMETAGELTIFTQPRDTFVSAERSAVHVDALKLEALPEVPHFPFTTPKIAAFLEACAERIVKAHAEGDGRSISAAHSLAAVARNLFSVDQMPKAAPVKPGSNIRQGQIDTYPEGSAIVRAGNDVNMPTPPLSAGYTAALTLLASRAMDLDKRGTCEHGANHLAALRDSLRNLKE